MRFSTSGSSCGARPCCCRPLLPLQCNGPGSCLPLESLIFILVASVPILRTYVASAQPSAKIRSSVALRQI